MKQASDSSPSKFSPSSKELGIPHIRQVACVSSPSYSFFFNKNNKNIVFYGIAEEIIFAKQYTFASCLPEVLLLRMNMPVFPARTQSPFHDAETQEAGLSKTIFP